MTASRSAPTEMVMSVRIELVPAPAMTAGIVKTPVPMMLPMTSAVAEVTPSRDWVGFAGVADGSAMTVDIYPTRFRCLPRGLTARSAIAIDRNKQALTSGFGVTESSDLFLATHRR